MGAHDSHDHPYREGSGRSADLQSSHGRRRPDLRLWHLAGRSLDGRVRRFDDPGTDRQCLTNIAAILEAAVSSLDKVVSATVILAEEDDFAGMNEEWLRWFPVDPPARQGAKLPVKVEGLKVSIAAISEV